MLYLTLICATNPPQTHLQIKIYKCAMSVLEQSALCDFGKGPAPGREQCGLHIY